MRTFTVVGGAMLLVVLAQGSSAQTPPAQGAPATPQTGERGRGPQRPPLLPTPPLTAPPTPDADGNFVIGPPYTPAPELTVKDGVPKGTIHEFTMDSKDSKIYSGIARAQPGAVVPYTRKVAVYVPAQYVAGTPAPFIVVQDGMSDDVPEQSAARSSTTSFTRSACLRSSRSWCTTAAAMPRAVSAASNTTRSRASTRISSRPKCSHGSRRSYGIAFTKDPEGRATMGGSSGAACAFTMAWFHPELYRRVLSYSGTYVNQQSPLSPVTPRGAWEYHATLIPYSPAKPIRIWMHVSEFDNRYSDQEDTWHNWVLANDRMAAALKAKGYKYQYVYSQNSRHVDRAVVAQTLPEALEWLWRGYPK